MTQEELVRFSGTAVGIVVLIIIVLWTAFWFIVPFVIYAILRQLRKIHAELERLNSRMNQNPSGRQESDATRNPFQ